MVTKLVKVGADADALMDVVFVHGLDGDAYKSWSGKSIDSFWPKWLADDIRGVAVWSLGYDAASSRWLGHAMPIQDRAVNLLAQLENYGIGQRPLCFVTHSMGGLVVKEMLLHAAEGRAGYAEFATATCGVVFLATPHTGSDVVTKAVVKALGVVYRRTRAVDALERNSAHLRQLNIRYRNWAASSGVNISHRVFHETQRTRGVHVVDTSSADPSVPGQMPIPVDANHIEICKPKDRSELVYGQVRLFITSLYDALIQLSDDDDATSTVDVLPGREADRDLPPRSWARRAGATQLQRRFHGDSVQPPPPRGSGAGLITVIPKSSEYVGAVAFHPSNLQLATSDQRAKIFRIWDATTAELLHEVQIGAAGTVDMVTFGPDGSTLATSSNDGTLNFFDGTRYLPKFGPVRTGYPAGSNNTILTYTPDGATLITVGPKGRVILLDGWTHDSLGGPLSSGHEEPWTQPRSVAVSPDSRLLATGGHDGEVMIYDIQSRRRIGVLLVADNIISSVAFAAQSRIPVAGCNDDNLYAWDMAAEGLLGEPTACPRRFSGHGAFDKVRGLMAVTPVDRVVRFWKPETGQFVHEVHTNHETLISAIAFSNDGHLVATAAGGCVRIHDISNLH